MRHILFITLLTAIACEDKDHCSAYVDYMCDCHADDPNYDCDEQRAIYEEASLEQQNECAIELDTQQQADQEEGTGCENEDSGAI